MNVAISQDSIGRLVTLPPNLTFHLAKKASCLGGRVNLEVDAYRTPSTVEVFLV